MNQLIFLVSYSFLLSFEGTRECKELDINVKCDHRANVRQTRQVSSPPTATADDTYVLDAIIPVEEWVLNPIQPHYKFITKWRNEQF